MAKHIANKVSVEFPFLIGTVTDIKKNGNKSISADFADSKLKINANLLIYDPNSKEDNSQTTEAQITSVLPYIRITKAEIKDNKYQNAIDKDRLFASLGLDFIMSQFLIEKAEPVKRGDSTESIKIGDSVITE
jgi:hypothetical protein